MYTIATLHQLQQRLDVPAGADDARLLEALQAASAQIERLANRHFTPSLATLRHTVDRRNPTELLLDDDLLELSALTNGDGSTIPLEDALLLPGGEGASGGIRLTGGRVFTLGDTPLRAVAVTGVWGWHDRWPQAWRNTDDTVHASMNTGDTTLLVANANGTDAASESPRLQVGHLLKVGDEYMRVLAIEVDPESVDTISVQRGANGTTAANHSPGAAIYTFQPAPDVVMLALRWAAWIYREPDHRGAGAVPPALLQSLENLRRVMVKV